MSDNLFATLMAGKPDEKIAFRAPGRPALGYAGLIVATARLAHRLRGLGVQAGDRVAVKTGKSLENLLLYLAVLRLGAIYLPLNTAYTPAETDYFLKDAEPRLFILDPSAADDYRAIANAAGARLETLGTNGKDGSLLAGVDDQPAGFDTVARNADDLAAILYTSGTTGRSKGAMLTHGNLLSNARTLVQVWGITADDRLLHALPVYHTHGLFVATNTLLLAGGAIDLLPKFDLDALFSGFANATMLMGVPTFYTRLLGDPRLTRAATAHMRLFISGSAPLLAETHHLWEEATGHRILERYGMTETNMICSNPGDGERRPGTVGPALPGESVRVVDDESGKPLPAGEIGTVEVKGPNVCKGYWRMPEKTAAAFRPDGYFITGDLGRLSNDGYLEIVGRGKDLIITGGLNVYPKEVEVEIDALDGVEESAVIGLPDDDFGESVAAVVVCKPGRTLSSEAILAAIAPRLARFKQPRAIFFADTLPRNSMGKVQKNILRERHRPA